MSRADDQRRLPLVLTWVLAVLVLGAWGAWAGPGWNPQPMANLIVPETEDTKIVSAVETAPLGTYEVKTSVHDVVLGDGTTLKVTLREPVGADGQSPGVVFLHGTGTDYHTAFEEHAEWMTSTGIVTAVPGKILDRYTTFERHYDVLASGYEAVAQWLRTQSSVYSRAVGYYGESEGALVAPVAVVDDPHTAFLILVSDPAMPIRDQGALAADSYLRNIGVPTYLYESIPRLLMAGLTGEHFQYANFDPRPYHRKITVPVMMTYGTNDLSMPIVQGPIGVAEDLKEAGNSDFVVRYYEGADHGLRIDHVLQSQPYQDISDFINGLPSSVRLSPKVAGGQPRQDFTAMTLDMPRWFGSGDAMLAILISGLLLTTLGSIFMLTGRYVGRQQTYRGVGRPTLVSGALLVVTWLVFIIYLLALAKLALSFESNRLVIHGGLLLVEILALATVYFLVRALREWYYHPMFTRQAGGDLRVVLAGQILLLFALAYWGIYPSPFF